MRQVSQWAFHFFVPHERNNFRATAVKLHTLAVYLLIIVSLSFVTTVSDETSNVLGYATDITISKLYELTNAQRQANGLAPLEYNEQLSQAAALKASDMISRNYWAHYGPDGTTPWSFILTSGYQYEYAGENLAKNFMFSDGVVNAWMDSPTHRDNILRSEYTQIGFAIQNGVLNGEETTLVVQMFGTPLAGTAVIPPTESAAAQNPQPQEQPVPQTDDQSAPFAQQPNPAGSGSQQTQPQAAPYIPQGNQEVASLQTPSWPKLAFNSKLIFIAFLIAAFLLDFIVAVRLNIIHLHLGGKHMAHVLFLFFVIAGLLIVTQGTIL
jgi:hypothetical protein